MNREERRIQLERRRRRKRRILRRKIRNFCRMVCLFGVLTLAVLGLAQFILNQDSEGQEILAVQKPEVRASEEVLSRLQEMGKKNKDFQKVYERASEYPEAILSALANNPEMIDFALGYPENDGKASGELTKKEKKEQYPLFLQWDKRWGYASYGSSNIGISGCGPTCLSMVIHALTEEKELTPGQVAQYSETQGYYVEGTGTSWSLMTEGAAAYGVRAQELPLSEERMKSELKAGKPIICAMGAGDFTTAGHFILIYGYEKDGFQINDPNCIARSERNWTYEELQWQIRNLWSYEA